jgi:hypothetical protein
MTRRSCPGPSVRCVSRCCRVLVRLDEVSREIAGYLPAVGSQRLEFKPAPDALSSVLTYCDMTTSPGGEPVPAGKRLAEIHHRYGPGHLVSRSIQRATPMTLRAVEHAEHRTAGSR